MQTYTIIAGVNGVGKSSLTGALLKTIPNLGYVIDIDKIAFTENISNIQASKKAISFISDFIEQGSNFAQETTLSGKMTAKTASLAKSRGYQVNMYYVGLDSVEDSINRIANRVKNGGHNISQEDVVRRFNNRFESLLNVLPYCDCVTFFDNKNGFVRVGEYTRENGLIKTTSHFPLWFSQFDIEFNELTDQYEKRILEIDDEFEI